MKNVTRIFYLLIFGFGMMHPAGSYATNWTTSTAGAITTLTNWTNGSSSPTTFATPGDTWTITQPMTAANWTVGTAASTPATVIITTGGGVTSSGGGTVTFNIYGNFNMTADSISATGGGFGGHFIMNVYGNFSMTGTSFIKGAGTIFGTTCAVHFALPPASGTMLISNVSSGVCTATTFYVDTSCKAQLNGNFLVNALTVNGTLICPAPYSVNGTGTFTVSNGATLEIANAAGINGHIANTVTSSLGSRANYVFNGSVPQVTGSYLPTSLVAPDTITINNSAGVTLSQNTATTGTLLFTSGTLHTGTFTMTTPGAAGGVVGAGSSSYVDGALTKTITGVSVVNYEVGDVDYAPINLTLSAAGTAGSLGIRCNHGLHPNVATSGILTSNIVNHYWSIINNSAAGPFSVIPNATYNFSDIIGGSNLSFVTQEYAGSAWLASPFATTNTSSPYTSVPTTGLTLGVLPGAYIYGNGCGTPITGTTYICSTGSTTTLSNASGGGTWSSSNPSVASVSGAGLVTGASTGAAVIFYNTASCSVSAVVTVGVSAITGTTSICPLSTSALSDATPGGIWSSSNTTVATVSASGVVYGISGGTANIYYAVGSCTPASVTVTVATLAGITGNPSICTGGTDLLSDATPGGVWTSNNTSVATVSGTGVVYGVSTWGTATISYTVGSCSAGFTVTDATIAPITGTTTLCGGTTTTLSDIAMWAGGTWSSSNTSIATVSVSGVVNALSTVTTQSVVMTYTYGSCAVTTSVTVNANYPISGPTSVCVGSVINISDEVAGGTWSSTNTTLATVGAVGGLGYVTGVSSATPSPRIIYTLPTGCTETITVTVSTISAITGSSVVCNGSTITLHDASTGGIWTSNNTTVATITPGPTGGGVVTGVSSGTTNISYTTSGCAAAVLTLTVSAIAPVTGGPTNVCVGFTVALSDAAAGGTWSSSNVARATVGSLTGIVTGVSSAGTPPVITYTMPGGCTATTTVTVTSISPITGMATICASGGTVTLHDAATGGTWTSSGGAATIGSISGTVTGVSAGVADITYSTASGGCSATATLTVNPAPGAIIGGPANICASATVTLSNATAGGAWSSANPGIANVGSGSGIVTGSSSGTATISYTLSGCSATTTVIVGPISPITGAANICAGGSVNLHDATTGGTWSSTSGVTVGSSSGVVTGVSAGAATITYTTAGGCTATATLTVNPLPAAITNNTAACMGSTITLSDATAGGIWTSSTPSIATVGTGTGIVSGVAGGTATITYSVSGCITTVTVLVNGPQVPQICVVYEDSATSKNLVVWEQFVPNRVEWFNIYRENSSSVFVKIDSQASNIFSTYLDTGSYPLLQSYSYQFTATDSCGNESPLSSSTIHTTVHLSANLGVGGSVNLIWNTYVGKPVTTQNIVRSVGGAPFVTIASVANTVTSYTDATPPSGTLVYKINSVMATGCSPSARTTAYDVVSSNPVEIGATGVNTLVYDPKIQIYPNPAFTSLIVTSTEKITNITITNLLGQTVYSNEYEAEKVQVDVSAFANGVYFAKINGSIVRKFIKE